MKILIFFALLSLSFAGFLTIPSNMFLEADPEDLSDGISTIDDDSSGHDADSFPSLIDIEEKLANIRSKISELNDRVAGMTSILTDNSDEFFYIAPVTIIPGEELIDDEPAVLFEPIFSLVGEEEAF